MAPPDHNGPFVQDDRGPGLLRRMFGGGTYDPAAPHQHTEASTSEMHDRAPRRGANPTPVAPSSGFPSTGRRVTVGSILTWILRRLGVRLTLAAFAGILVLIGSLGDDGSSAVDETGRGLQELRDSFTDGDYSAQDPAGDATTPAPNDSQRGTFRVTVDQVLLDHATFTDSRGIEYVWNVEEPLVYGSLALNAGEEVLVYWEDRGGTIYVVGVEGPRSTNVPERSTDVA